MEKEEGSGRRQSQRGGRTPRTQSTENNTKAKKRDHGSGYLQGDSQRGRGERKTTYSGKSGGMKVKESGTVGGEGKREKEKKKK